MKYLAVFIIMGCLMVSCSKRGEDTGESVKRNYKDTTKLSFSEYKIERKSIYAIRFLDPNLTNYEEVAELDTISVSKIKYPYRTVFIYDNGYHADTLSFYKDSVAVFSEADTKFIETKMVVYKGGKVRADKYQYVGTRPMMTVDSGRLSNMFVNDSLGIMFEIGTGLPGGSHIFFEYDTRLKEVHDAILRDTVFNKRVFDF